MGTGFNPYRNRNGQFGSGPKKKRIQYASSDEWKDAIEANEDLKESQINKAEEEKNRLNKEEERRSLDKRIVDLQNEIEYQKERAASAMTVDDRQSAEAYIRRCNKAIKNLKSKRDSL